MQLSYHILNQDLTHDYFNIHLLEFNHGPIFSFSILNANVPYQNIHLIHHCQHAGGKNVDPF